jgi:transglutaminase-like putative cysteine protease
VTLFRPLPSRFTRPVSILVVIAWIATMALLINRSYLQAASASLAADLARYGSAAEWRGVYYRGEKIGFTVNQVVPADDGFELQEDGRLQMSLLGSTSAASLRTTARVDREFALRSFDFSLDPGTGPVTVRGRIDGTWLDIAITTSSGTRTERRDLGEPPMLSINLGRRLAAGGLRAGGRHTVMLFDPATLRNTPAVLDVGPRELVTGERRVPAFRVDLSLGGMKTTSWITDTGEVVREESPMGMIVVRESAARARQMTVAGPLVQTDLLEGAAVVPVMTQRIDRPRDVRRLRLRIDGADLAGLDLAGVGQSVTGNVVEIRDAQSLTAGPADPEAARYIEPEPFIESDDPDVKAEAEKAVERVAGARARAERLTRHVNALLEKKPTVSIPSAREVLRTRVGDCNEHTALYVAMARALRIPARVAVGLVFTRGAFYYHAWPEVYVDAEHGRGLWLPVDPTLNEFPADATHLRLARGGLDRQAAILPLIGRLELTVLDLELAPDSTPVLVGRQAGDLSALTLPVPRRAAGGCWSFEPPRARVRQAPRPVRR